MPAVRTLVWILAAAAAALLPGAAACGLGAGSDDRPPVVVFTDYDTASHALAAIKGEIYTEFPAARITDGAVGMPPFDVVSAASIIALGASTYPAGTVLLCVVNPDDLPASQCLVAVSTDGRVFVAPDNGVLTRVAADPGFTAMYRFTDPTLAAQPLAEAPADTVLPRAAARIAAGAAPAALGEPVPEIATLTIPEPRRAGSIVSGAVIFFSSFGDCLTNIPASLLAEAGMAVGDRVSITFDGVTITVPLAAEYGDVPAGTAVAVLEGSAPLAFGINQEDIAREYGITAGTAVTVGPAATNSRD